MFAPLLLAAATTSLLLLTSARADDPDAPYSKFISDANSLLAAATGTDAAQLSALNQWQVTETAIPSAVIEEQYQDYLNAYMTATSAPLPAWVTAIPSSLQPVVSSFLQAEASLVYQDIAPMISQDDVEASSYVIAAQTTATATADAVMSSGAAANVTTTSAAPNATATSLFATGGQNATVTQVSGNGTTATPSANQTTATLVTTSSTTSPTNSVTPPTTTPQQKPTSGAERSGGVAMVGALVGILGMMVLL